MDTNYFACTLGQASTLNRGPKAYRTINDFLSHQARHHGHLPAVGFPLPDRQNWSHQVFTFSDINNGALVFAKRLSASFESLDAPQTVALLCHSSSEFLFTWLALMQLGHSVLLVAPQCQPAAIVHLCKTCEISFLLHDIAHCNRAQETESLAKKEGFSNFEAQPIPLDDVEDLSRLIKVPVQSDISYPNVDQTTVAYLHHTSGTSSGLPKPVPQTHRAAIGVLPHLPETPAKATFTTTPLYHGGIADLFRSWTSDSLIWLFPGKDAPITASNICHCLDTAHSWSATGQNPEIRYFSSVPYVLQIMGADEEGLDYLRHMDIVGVGGAALPAEVGDRLVDKGVNLISRFGSAECGFLLSSYRDFIRDKEWLYLRNYSPPELLNFQIGDDGLSELVVKSGWPHMAKRNRSDGSFATADLFIRQSQVANAWLYHSRADSQLTLITGKKFDPAPLEAAIAISPLLDDVVIFGNNRPFPGALLLRSEQSNEKSDDELLQAIEPVIKKLNSESQDHARIPYEMLIPLPHQTEPLEKSSKGTIIRKSAEARFEKYINSAYELQGDSKVEDVEDKELPQYLVNLIKSVVSKSTPLTKDADLFAYGVDSIACMQLRNRLRRLIPNYHQELPLSIVEDCGTVRRLSEYIMQKRHGGATADIEDEEQQMLDLVNEYSNFKKRGTMVQNITNGCEDGDNFDQIVVLTGATGALGAHILDLLRTSDKVSVVYCLVRGADQNSAYERVSKALEQRGLAHSSSSNKHSCEIKVVQAKLGEPQLGLPEKLYDYLAAEVTHIIHVAWTVNFRLRLRSFVKDNIAGVKHLLDLALKSPRAQPPRFAYCSSTAAIMNGELDQSGCLPERILQNPLSASPLGYSRSKWVAESICEQAHHQTALRGRIAVVRVGQLSGDSETGIWNTKEAYPMMLSTAKLIGYLPSLPDEPLTWLPIDIAARAFLEAALCCNTSKDQLQVYHVLNPYQQPTWNDMLQWLKKKYDFEVISPAEWISRLESSKHSDHSSMKLLGLWKETYCNGSREQKARPQFSLVETKKRIPILREVQPVHEEYMNKIWTWVQENVH